MPKASLKATTASFIFLTRTETYVFALATVMTEKPSAPIGAALKMPWAIRIIPRTVNG
jgi:hypothetical protein